jgi:D-alanyl-D-alanine carboxypeptidase/D-alanyl-D-alanine-endopeptidase (penicillin-binding protein 4)
MYRLFSLLILTFLVNYNIAQLNLQKAVDHFVKDVVNKNASLSIQIIDLDNDSSLASYHEYASLMCASTAKLFSTSSALKILGNNYQAQTRFYTNGYVDSLGILRGDLWIRGGGDVSLGSKYFNDEGNEFNFMHDWLDSLKNNGLKGIDGRLITDGSEFGYAGVPDGWGWSDMGNYYGVGASGINFFDNTLKYYFKTGKPGESVQFIGTNPVIDDLFFQHDILAENIRKDYSYIYGSPYSKVRFGHGSLPAYKDSFCVKGSMPDPEMQLAIEFGRYLEDSSFNISKGVFANRFLPEKSVHYDSLNHLFSYSGKSVIDIVNKTNLYSVNLYAEGLLNLLGYYYTGKGSTNSGISTVYRLWRNKVSAAGLSLKDGSGLSRKNAVSSSHFCQLLKAIYSSDIYADFKGSLSVAGNKGTMKYVCRRQKGENRIFAKSGTLSNVKAYSGYVQTESGKNLAFALIANNFNCSKSQIVNKMELVFNAMAAY